MTAIFYTDDKYNGVVSLKKRRLKKLGFEVIHYTMGWLKETRFYKQNSEILDMPRGAGYWIWKPYIILETLKTHEVVFYTDAGDKPKDNIREVIDKHMEDHDYMIGCSPFRPINGAFTKRDCFILMDCDSMKYYSAIHAEAGNLVFNRNTTHFLNEWLVFCKKKDIITDTPSTRGFESDMFRRHVGDQSILSNLVAKYDMKLNEELFLAVEHNYYDRKYKID